jgi:hypothetical protein
LREKECFRRVVNVEKEEVEEWKQNWDEDFMDEV